MQTPRQAKKKMHNETNDKIETQITQQGAAARLKLRARPQGPWGRGLGEGGAQGAR